MRIGIVGNYGNDNQGDEAILEGILYQIEEAYQIARKDILVFSNNPPQTREKYGVQSVNLFQRRKTDPMKFLATIKHNKPIIRELDVLLIGGGGILMDLYRNNPIVYGMYALLARLTKTPAIIYGAGVGPINTTIGKKIICFIGNTAKVVMVRDPKSQALLESIGVKKPIHVISDPAFFVPAPEKIENLDESFQIGVTAVSYYHKDYWPKEDKEVYQNYIQGMARNLDKILEANPSAFVNFFSTKHPVDTNVTKEIKELMKYQERTTVTDKNLPHGEVLDFVNKQDLVIGTRLHSLILALVTDKPIIAVSYHQKVKDFMDSTGAGKYVIPIEDVHKKDDFFYTLYEEMYADWGATERNFTALADQIKTKQPRGMDIVKEVTQQRLGEK